MESQSAGGMPGGPSAVAGLPTQPSPRPTPRVTVRVSRRRWWTVSLLLLLAFVVLGAGPVALTVRLLAPAGLRLPTFGALGGPGQAASPTATPRDLSLPRMAWVARMIYVRAAAGSNTVVALLQPGFPVQIQAHATVSGATWDRIVWAGPTPATGGQGWAPDAAISAIGGAGPAVGDVGALSPHLAATLGGLGANIGLAVYYPAAGQLYLTNGDALCALGDAGRGPLLAALLAQVPLTPPTPTPGVTATTPTNTVTATPTPTPSTALAQLVARGDPIATTLAYQHIGGAPGLKAFASFYGLLGISTSAPDWTQTQATPRTLAQFYAELDNLAPAPDSGQLNHAGRAQALTWLASAGAAATPAFTSLLTPPVAGAQSLLVAGSDPLAATWGSGGSASGTVSAAGVVTLPNSVTYVIAACASGAATPTAGAQTVNTMLTSVAAITQQ